MTASAVFGKLLRADIVPICLFQATIGGPRNGAALEKSTSRYTGELREIHSAIQDIFHTSVSVQEMLSISHSPERDFAIRVLVSLASLLQAWIPPTHAENPRVDARGAVKADGPIRPNEVGISGFCGISTLDAIHAASGDLVSLAAQNLINLLLAYMVVWKVSAARVDFHEKEAGGYVAGFNAPIRAQRQRARNPARRIGEWKSASRIP